MPSRLHALICSSARIVSLCACLFVLLPGVSVQAQKPADSAGGTGAKAEEAKAENQVKNSSGSQLETDLPPADGIHLPAYDYLPEWKHDYILPELILPKDLYIPPKYASMLLELILSQSPHTENAPDARPAKDASLADGTYVLPVRKGDRILAEFVGCEYSMGTTNCRFLSPDNTMYYILFGACERESDCEMKSGEDSERFKAIDDNKNLGKQFIIVPNKIERYIHNYDGTDIIFVQAKSVKLDKRKGAPKNTKVLPYQEISGKIMCERDKGGLSVYLTTDKGIMYDLVPYTGDAYREFWTLCNIKRITLKGEILLWVEGENAFKIRCNDNFGSECFTPDKEN